MAEDSIAPLLSPLSAVQRLIAHLNDIGPWLT